MSIAGLRPSHVALILAALTLGLAADVHTDLAGQAAIGAAVWALLLYLLAHFEREDRRALLACLVIATLGEIAASLVWGLYTYRLGNIPPFVPPGHVLMLLLGVTIAQRLPNRAADAILAAAAVYALAAAALGFDTLAVPLCLALAVVSLGMPGHRRLYASTFVAALALELYGTWLGNWTWAREVPFVGLTTTNPPAVAGAFYAVLDAMVAVTALLFARGFGWRPARHAT